jgi:hypothetical protein
VAAIDQLPIMQIGTTNDGGARRRVHPGAPPLNTAL